MSRYDDIIQLPHHVSERRAPMSLQDRAAQFSPFAALTGYDAVIAETGRLTERFVELDEGSIQQINEQLREILSRIDRQPTVTVIWFQPDEYKDGGSYETKTGRVKKVDAVSRSIQFTDRTQISFHQILEIRPLPD